MKRTAPLRNKFRVFATFHGRALDKAADAGYSDLVVETAELGFSHSDGTGFYQAQTLPLVLARTPRGVRANGGGGRAPAAGYGGAAPNVRSPPVPRECCCVFARARAAWRRRAAC
jgi:hypothetical protein